MHPSSIRPARAGGTPVCTGLIRHTLEDFRVSEQLGFDASGEGPHVLLRVEKTGRTTGEVAELLAGHAGAPVRDVGYSGLKDKHAVAEQWFTVPAPDRITWRDFRPTGVRVISARRHRRKLKRGAHVANHFVIRVNLESSGSDELERRLVGIGERGVPNYFGEQRFGSRFEENAQRLAAGAKLPRLQRSMTLSAMRSALFNRVLDRRVREASWDTALEGEYVMLDGTRSGFAAQPDDAAIEARIRTMDLHPSGPLFGRGSGPARGAAAALEDDVLAESDAWCEVLSRAGLKMERRPTRCQPRGLCWSLEEDGRVLQLSFSLQRGQFATAVLREIIDYRDVTRRGEGPARDGP